MQAAFSGLLSFFRGKALFERKPGSSCISLHYRGFLHQNCVCDRQHF